MSSILQTNPDRPIPNEVASETRRVHGDDMTPADEDWFRGNIYPRVSTVENADRMDAAPPLDLLEDELIEQSKALQQAPIEPGKCAIYWMRMNDMRLRDNRALSLASAHAQKHSIPLVVLFTIVPAEYKAHDRSKRRVDFVLRNLRSVQQSLGKLNIPLLTLNLPTSAGRRSVPKRVLDWAESKGATHIWADLTYEVDELQRDIRLLTNGRKRGFRIGLEHDRLIIPPGGVKKKTGGGIYTVYSPWYRVWASMIAASPKLIEPYPDAAANEASALKAFEDDISAMPIPDAVEGFELDPEDAKKMKEVHPEGETAAMVVLQQFLTTKAISSKLGAVNPTEDGPPASKKESRIESYADGRNEADKNTTSRLSPYLASGILSPRVLLKETANLTNGKLVTEKKGSGIGTWVSEVAWRDFYNHILAAYPRVSMGQPYNVKYRGVQWETDPKMLEAWKKGRTGYPIVDAAMRQCNEAGWMHNRSRMIAASFLAKDLMIDWRLGERYFMTCFVDGDLASNNGGWQWTASTGTDPQPYFRIFNPTSQSEKADPSGDYIRHFVPELRGLKGKDVHDPYGRLSPAVFKKLGYPEPIVEHKMARERALGRFKNVGEKPDEDGSAAAKGDGKRASTKKIPGKGSLDAFGFSCKPKSGTSVGSKRKKTADSESEEAKESGAEEDEDEALKTKRLRRAKVEK